MQWCSREKQASNSLLESLVFAQRAARHIMSDYSKVDEINDFKLDESEYLNYQERYKDMVLTAIEKERNNRG